MKYTLIIACLFAVSGARAQLPVVDAAAIAKAVAMLAELQEQVRLLTDNLAVTREIHAISSNHLQRYRRALTKRGVVESLPLQRMVDEVEAALAGALSYMKPDEISDVYILHAMPEDPLRYDRNVSTQSMNTVSHTMRALGAHAAQIEHSHRELERFKREIAANPEPQQMMDVQASLQVLASREALLTRQALMTLINLETIRAAEALDEKAQRRTVYNSFVGQVNWLGDPRQYQVKRFLRMPGE